MTCTVSELLLIKEKVAGNPVIESMAPSAEQTYRLAPEKLNAELGATVGYELALATGSGTTFAGPCARTSPETAAAAVVATAAPSTNPRLNGCERLRDGTGAGATGTGAEDRGKNTLCSCARVGLTCDRAEAACEGRGGRTAPVREAQ